MLKPRLEVFLSEIDSEARASDLLERQTYDGFSGDQALLVRARCMEVLGDRAGSSAIMFQLTESPDDDIAEYASIMYATVYTDRIRPETNSNRFSIYGNGEFVDKTSTLFSALNEVCELALAEDSEHLIDRLGQPIQFFFECIFFTSPSMDQTSKEYPRVFGVVDRKLGQTSDWRSLSSPSWRAIVGFLVNETNAPKQLQQTAKKVYLTRTTE